MPYRDNDHFACSICARPLNRAEDPLSVNCGGDCLGCIIVAEDGNPAPDLPDGELRAWIEARNRRMSAMWAEAAREIRAGDAT